MRAAVVLGLLATLLGFRPAAADTARTLPRGTWKADVRYLAVFGGPLRYRQQLSIPGQMLESLGLDVGGSHSADTAADVSLGEVDLVVEFGAQVLAPGLAYGIRDWLSVGLVVPVFVDGHVSVRHFEFSGPWGYNPEFTGDRSRSLVLPAFDSRAVGGTAGMQQALVEAFEYEPIGDFRSSGLGDVVLAARAALVRSQRTVVSLQPELSVPTGRTDDPDNLVDFGFGDGHVSAGAAVLLERAVGARSVLFGRLGASWTRSHRLAVRVYTDPGLPLAPKAGWPEPYGFIGSSRDVERDPGDRVDGLVGLSHNLSSRWRILGRYGLRQNWADRLRADGERLAALEQDTARRVHEIGAGVAFSTAEDFVRGTARIPVQLQVDLARRLSSTREAEMTIVTVSVAAFFATGRAPAGL